MARLLSLSTSKIMAAKGKGKSVFILAATFIIAISALFVPEVSSAATKTYPSSYFAAQKAAQSADIIETQIGEQVLFSIGFKNTGKATWSNSGKQYVSIYTAEPYYRNSKFADESWISAEQPAAMKNETIKPGETGYVEFKLKAPSKPGDYKESFVLAAENTKFISGSKITVKIKVHEKPAYSASKLIQSADQLTLQKGESANFTVGFKNTGRLPWTNRAIIKSGVTMATTDPNLFVDPSWIDFYIPTKIAEEQIKPGQVTYFNFKIKAPEQSGNYVLKLVMQADDQEVEGGEFEIPVTVTDESFAPPTEPIFVPIMDEPKIRIGLFESEPSERLHANGTFELQDANGNVIMAFEQNELVTLKPYAGGVHYLQTNLGKKYSSANYFRFVPKTATYFILPTYRNPVSWNRSLNDNFVRGEIEFRYSPEKNKFYVINVLTLEDYVKGIAETSNGSPYEFQKAQAIAARTYALYYILNGGKHPTKNFDLNTLQYDQVYRGYNSEQRLSNFAKAAEETRGMVITYDDKIVMTPYFGRSNGNTRPYHVVWGGAVKPWLVSRPCHFDAGKKRYGHGVGMSQTDAMGQANAGLDFENILKLYYTGVEIKKVYE